MLQPIYLKPTCTEELNWVHSHIPSVGFADSSLCKCGE